MLNVWQADDASEQIDLDSVLPVLPVLLTRHMATQQQPS